MLHQMMAAGVSARLVAQEWPQWRGVNRDGSVSATGAAPRWPDKLKQVWSANVGEGHSSPVVSGNRVFQFARQGDMEVLLAFELGSGQAVWKQAYPAPYEMNSAAVAHGKGPKSTPAISGGRIYSFGISGVLTCLRIAGGNPVWRYDSSRNFRQTSPTFGVAMSPILLGPDLIAHIGSDDNGALTAFDAASGKIRWQWKGDGPAYSSPVVLQAAGKPQIVTFSAKKLIGVNAGDGTLAWELPFTTPYAQNSVTPFVLGDVIVYSGLANPVTAIRVTPGGVQKLWENKEAGMYMSSPVLAAGLLHGLSNRNKGMFFSLDPKTGKTVWTSDGRQGENAMLVSRGSDVFALTTESELQIMRASARGLEPVRKYTVANSPTWAHPVVLESRLLVKDKETLALWAA